MAKKRLSLIRAAAGAASAAAAILLPPGAAHACGGFFCNRPVNPSQPEIAQVAENVAFAVDRTSTGESVVEAHVQILYTGPADKFSWVVPTLALPELSTGINQLFQKLEPATRPTFSFRWQVEGDCKGSGGSANSAGGCGATAGGGTRKSSDGGGGGSSGKDGGVDVAFRGDVGPYDAAVIKSDDPMELRRWLTDNMYYVSEEAGRIVDQYVAEHAYFVALKLLNSADVKEIVPIVLRMPGDIACVPLRLTAIASTPDLRVNVWVLGGARSVPINYLEVKLNQARIDWMGNGANYEKLLQQAADEAGGNAFAVEYAGSTTFMQRTLWSGQYDLGRLGGKPTPPDYVEELLRQAFPLDGQMLGVLRRFIPMPPQVAGKVTEANFYKNLRMYYTLYKTDFKPFDPAEISAEIDRLIVTPLKNAQSLFDRHGKVTRLVTFISPEEMTKDPMFIYNKDLPDVSNRMSVIGRIMCGEQNYYACNAPVRIDTPDGHAVWYLAPADEDCNNGPTPSYSRGDLDKLPAAEVAWERSGSGEGRAPIDNRKAIEDALRRNADQAGVGRPPPLDDLNPAACGCRLPGGGGSAALAFFGLAFLSAAARRRHR